MFDPASRMWFSCAAASANRGKLDAAAVCAQRSLNLAPDDAEVLAHLGSIQYRLKRYEEAAASLQKAESADPNCGTVAYVLALTRHALGDSAKELSDEVISRATRELMIQVPAWGAVPAPTRRKRSAPFLQQRADKLYLEIARRPALMWQQPSVVWRGLALTNIRAAAALQLGPDLSYPILRHVFGEVCKQLDLDRLGGRDDLPEMIEIARSSGQGVTVHHAACEVAYKSQTNARDRYAMQQRLRKAFPKHEDLYRMIAASDDIDVAIDEMILQLERQSIKELDFAAVLRDFARRHG